MPKRRRPSRMRRTMQRLLRQKMPELDDEVSGISMEKPIQEVDNWL